MAPRRILYYVSGHGHGHARRSAEICRAIVQTNSEFHIVVRTTAPANIFADMPRCTVTAPLAPVDSGAIEEDILTIDVPSTLSRVRDVLRNRRETINIEAAYLRSEAFDMVLADIPFLAADIAKAAAIPAIGISNFTWDFIYAPFLEGHSDKEEILAHIRSSYSKFSVFIQLPFNHPLPGIRKTFQVGLMAQNTHRTKTEILEDLGITPEQSKFIVLFGMRSGVPPISAFADAGKEFLFFLPGPAGPDWPENVRAIPRSSRLGFVELMKVAPVAVSKVGFGILADCIAAQTGLLFPLKEGFKEDELTEAAAAEYLRSWPIPRRDFEAGNWAPYLRTILTLPPPTETLKLDGAEQCARIITQCLRDPASH